MRTGLRRIISDLKASRGMRMKAIQLLITIEGIQPGTTGIASVSAKSSANARRLKELAQQVRKERVGQGLPGETVSH